jgi:hypothetical protein
MEQLKSPPVSARAIAQWLIENYHHPKKPLASVALLLSDSTNRKFTLLVNGRRETVTAAPADMETVRSAIEAWREIGHTRPDHLLLFFFCGHGLALGSDLALLVSDFGAKRTAPLSAAIDFRRLWRGMDECAAREQCYFIDACRIGSELLIRNSGYAGDPIIQQTGAMNATGRVRQAPIFFSTLTGTAAYAKPGKPSLYTEALLEALGGAGCDTDGGPWRVQTSFLHHALGVLAEEASQRMEIPQAQIATADEMALITLNEVATPQVPVIVTCKPDKFNLQATLTCKNSITDKKRRPAKGAWRLSLPVDNYDFDAKVKTKNYSRRAFEVRPVLKRVELEVK